MMGDVKELIGIFEGTKGVQIVQMKNEDGNWFVRDPMKVFGGWKKISHIFPEFMGLEKDRILCDGSLTGVKVLRINHDIAGVDFSTPSVNPRVLESLESLRHDKSFLQRRLAAEVKRNVGMSGQDALMKEFVNFAKAGGNVRNKLYSWGFNPSDHSGQILGLK